MEGWVDYLVPQLYWNIGNPVADYKTLAEWWNNNSYGRNIFIGQSVYKIGTDKNEDWMRGNQISSQITINRSLKNIHGNVFFNTNAFMKNPLGLKDSLKRNYYKYYALTPVLNNNGNLFPNPPENGTISMLDSKLSLKWDKPDYKINPDTAIYYVIYKFPEFDSINISNQEKIVDIIFGSDTNWTDTLSGQNISGCNYVITSLDKNKYESNDLCRISFPKDSESILTAANYLFSSPDSLEVISQNNNAKIIITLGKLNLVTLKIFDSYGKEIKEMLHEYRDSGRYEFEFKEKDIKSKGYIVQLKTRGYYYTKKIYIN